MSDNVRIAEVIIGGCARRVHIIIIAYGAARNIAFPYDYGPLLGRRACVGGTTAYMRQKRPGNGRGT